MAASAQERSRYMGTDVNLVKAPNGAMAQKKQVKSYQLGSNKIVFKV
jgi:hypothetical protein